MTTYFTDKAFRFLRALEHNNEREWFHAHKADYETHLREPFQRLLTDLQPDLATVSLHYRADPKKMNGSLFRIHRDTRFSNNKAPYKNWQSARLFHERHRETAAPAWYLQLRPDDSFFAAGIWNPESPVLRQIRQFIVDNPAGWKSAAHAPTFRRRYRMSESDMLVRRPRGFPEDFPFIDDLRHRNFVFMRSLDADLITGPGLRQTLIRALKAPAPFMGYLCAALALAF